MRVPGCQRSEATSPWTCSWLLVILLACAPSGCTSAPQANPQSIAHAVFLTLDRSDADAIAALVKDCRALAQIEGVLALRAGPRAAEMQRSRNDLQFDVALHIVFVDRGALDAYVIHPLHRGLLQTWESRLRRIRVFDYAPESGR